MPPIPLTMQEARYDNAIGGNLGYRQYSHRLAQEGSGAYQTRLIHSMNRGGSLTLRYRLWKKLLMVLTSSVVTYSSNTRYEANYPYNYTVAPYLGGLSWEY